MNALLRFGLFGLLLISLTACGLNNLMKPSDQQRQDSLDTFLQALRLGEYQVAASYLTPEHRAAFLKQFESLEKDLTIVDTRVGEMNVLEQGRKVDVSLKLDYFLLPSATVKSLQYDHTWVAFDATANQPAGYLIKTPFPTFP